MRPSARLQAAILLLDEIIIAARDGGASADQLANRFFAARRYAGSKDRRAVRDLAWRAIRRFGECPQTARAAFVTMAQDDPALAALFDGSEYGPASIGVDEARAAGGAIPRWMLPLLPGYIDADEQASLLARAPLDLRANALKIGRADAAAAFTDAQILPASPFALRLPTGTAVENHPAIRDGRVEIQDLGSQIIADICAVQPGMTVLDLCAGAGGKTLALAAAMGGQGRIIASDTNRARLQQLAPRAARAGAGNIETLLLGPGKESAMLAQYAGRCDIILVDAPCSGSGTWRRNPETRWRLTPARLARTMAEQARLMNIASQMVAGGGHLIYAVCSIFADEGERQVAEFLVQNSRWRAVRPVVDAGRVAGDGLLLTPHHDGCDGFFLARLEKL